MILTECKGSAKELTRRITDDLINIHREGGWRADREIRFFPRRIDVLAIAPQAAEVIAFEVKVSLADFRQDVANPDKRQAVLSYCSQFYYVTPEGLVDQEQVPDGCGLIYYREPHYEEPYPYFEVVTHCQGRNSVLLENHQERVARIERDRILEDFHDWEREIMDDSSDDLGLPRWMAGRSVKPLRFQFNVDEVAAKMASVLNPESAFCEVPF